MCPLNVMCPKAKPKSGSSTKSKKHSCHECITRDMIMNQLNKMYLPPIPMPMLNQNQLGYKYDNGFNYMDYASWWEDNYPAMVSVKEWKDHAQTAKNMCDSVQENGKKIGEVKSAIEETQAGVKTTDSHVKDAHKAVDLAQQKIENAHGTVKEANKAIQNTINDKHAELLSKQAACAADVARVRELLEGEAKKREEEAKKREENRRVAEEVVKYRDRNPIEPVSPFGRRRPHLGEDEKIIPKWWERGEQLDWQRQQSYYLKAITDAQLRLREAEWELELLRPRDT
ncbi:hypothetical protein F5Y09DRAFT_113286 [Xylaria sp. FL1042]|nr:hypothetical protein F5Y09DRAFT_113286 [Xylaria sp. FL1042]